jgi:hemolysin-activating ACP:hemolysin acyltransferase
MDDYQTLGTLTWLAMTSKTHERLPSGSFMRQLRPALQQGRVRLLFRQGQPHAWLAWRLLDDAAHQRQLHALGQAQTPRVRDSWHWWLDFWVRPYGCDDQLAEAVMTSLRHIAQSVPLPCPPPRVLNWYDPSPNAWHLHIEPEQLIGL